MNVLFAAAILQMTLFCPSALGRSDAIVYAAEGANIEIEDSKDEMTAQFSHTPGSLSHTSKLFRGRRTEQVNLVDMSTDDNTNSFQSIAPIPDIAHRVLGSDSCYPTARSIRIESYDGTTPIQMFDFKAFTPSGKEVAHGKRGKQSSTYKGKRAKFGASKALDESDTTFSHTDTGDVNAFWEVNLGQDQEIKMISIKNRFCKDVNDLAGCLCRMTNSTIKLLDGISNHVVHSAKFGDTCGQVNLSLEFDLCRPAPVSCPAKRIKLYKVNFSEEVFQMFEVQVYSAGTNVAPNGVASQSSTYKNKTNFAASKAIDKSGTTFSHTHTDDKDPWWELELPESIDVDSVVIMNRWCENPSDPQKCLCRLSDARILLIDESGNIVDAANLGWDTCNQLIVETTFSSCSAKPQVITATDDINGGFFGSDVHVSGYGNDAVAIVGASPGDDVTTLAYVFAIDPITLRWTQAVSLIVNNTDDATNAPFGYAASVSISGNRNDAVAVISAQWNDGFKGAAYVFAINATAKTVMEPVKLTASDGAEQDLFGYDLSIIGNGMDAVAIVGAPGKSSSTGAVYIHVINATAGASSQAFQLSAIDSIPGDKFGMSVDISGGSNDAVAIIGTDSKQKAYVYAVINGIPSEINKLSKEDSLFGASVSISGNSNNAIAVVGDPLLLGAAYVYAIDAKVTGDIAKALTLRSVGENDWFTGQRVSVHGNADDAVAVISYDSGQQVYAINATDKIASPGIKIGKGGRYNSNYWTAIGIGGSVNDPIVLLGSGLDAGVGGAAYIFNSAHLGDLAIPTRAPSAPGQTEAPTEAPKLNRRLEDITCRQIKDMLGSEVVTHSNSAGEKGTDHESLCGSIVIYGKDEDTSLTDKCGNILYRVGLKSTNEYNGAPHFAVLGTLDPDNESDSNMMINSVHCPQVIVLEGHSRHKIKFSIETFFDGVDEDMYVFGKVALGELLDAENKAATIVDEEYNFVTNNCVHYAASLWQNLGFHNTKELGEFLVKQIVAKPGLRDFVEAQMLGSGPIVDTVGRNLALADHNVFKEFVEKNVYSQLHL